MKTQKVYFKQIAPDMKTGKPRYEVKKLINLTEPRIGAVLSESEVNTLRGSRVTQIEIT